jgi:hypothetical protein
MRRTTRRFGKVCAKHPELNGERAANGSCIGCARAATKAWARANPEKVRGYSRAWYLANAEKRRAETGAWAKANPDKKLKSGRAWRAANPDKSVAFSLAWQAANPAKVAAAHARRRARKAAALVPLTADEKARVEALYAEARRLTEDTGEEHQVHHDRPLARGGKHHPDNLLVVTAAMNCAIGARYDSTWDYIST